MRVQIIDNFDAIGDMVDRAEKVALLKIAARVRDVARASMKEAASLPQGKEVTIAGITARIGSRRASWEGYESAPPGEPPYVHFGDLRRSIGIGLNIDTDEVVIGPQESIVGVRGNVLEFAGTFVEGGRDAGGRFQRGRQSRKAPSGAKWAHPFMRPALEQVQETFAGDLAGSFE